MIQDQLIERDAKVKEPFESLYKLNIGLSIDEFEAKDAMLAVLNEKDFQKRLSLLTMLLNGIMIKGPSVYEVKGLIDASLSLDDRLKSPKQEIALPNNEILIGVASSGKKGLKTINITTPACFIAAASGAYIAKACSHSTSSKTGSTDFLELIGINLDTPFDTKVKILQENNIAFFSIEDSTPLFAQVYGGVFYAPHAMSFALAGLSFPVKVDALVYGLSHPNVKLALEVYKEYGLKNVLVYSSSEDGVHYLDELPIAGHVNIIGMKNGEVGRVISANIRDTFPFFDPNYSLKNIAEKDTPIDNVAASLKVLAGVGLESHTDAICLNAAPMILLAGKAKSLNEGYLLAKESLNSGKAFKLLMDVVRMYGGDQNRIINLIKGFDQN